MKINYEFIKLIFSGKAKLKTKKDKIKLSLYNEYIPMYDIYSKKIYPISKENLYFRLMKSHYRFINNEVINWLKNQIKKMPKSSEERKSLEENLIIMDNYDIETLIKNSYETTFKFSQELGLDISICKRNSFNRFFSHLKPYYSKMELVNLGLNMNVISEKEEKNSIKSILDEKIHYKICKNISKNDISSKEIIDHSIFLIEKNALVNVSFYSFIGSYYMNKILRNNLKALNQNNIYLKNISKLNKLILNSPDLKNDYFLYRFIWDDYFIKNLKIGDIFTDKGFTSTTRDPFYSPGTEIKFGIVLAKIKISKKTKGILLENFSVFPKEEEFILPPNSKLKLISKDDNFKYYHINKNYENMINKKYEFEVIDSNLSTKQSIQESESSSDKDRYDWFTIKSDLQSSNQLLDKIQIIKNFINTYGLKNSSINYESDLVDFEPIKISFYNRKYDIYFNWFDGTDSYESLYYNKNKDGMFFTIYDEFDYPYLNIEFGDKMVVNHLNRKYYYNEKRKIDYIDILFLVDLAYIFTYSNFMLDSEYRHFGFHSDNVDLPSDEKIALFKTIYNNTLYEYIKNGNKFYSYLYTNSNPSDISNVDITTDLQNKITNRIDNYFKFDYGYTKIDSLKKSNIPEQLLSRFNNDESVKSKNYFEFIGELIERHPLLYPKFEEIEKNFLNQLFLLFNVTSFCKNILKYNISFNYGSNNYNSGYIENDPSFKIVFRNPIRRII